MDIRPIRTEDQHNWALAEVTRYFENEPEPDSTDGDRFAVLATLIEAYEDEHYPATVPDPVESIQAHMEMAGFKQAVLADPIGSRSRASEVLSRRKRPLTMDMAFKCRRSMPARPISTSLPPSWWTPIGRSRRRPPSTERLTIARACAFPGL